MNKEDGIELLSCIKELSKNDVIIDTFLKFAEIDARMSMIGESVSKDYIDDVIVANNMKSMLKSILIFQSKRIEELLEDLKESQLKRPIVLKMD